MEKVNLIRKKDNKGKGNIVEEKYQKLLDLNTVNYFTKNKIKSGLFK